MAESFGGLCPGVRTQVDLRLHIFRIAAVFFIRFAAIAQARGPTFFRGGLIFLEGRMLARVPPRGIRKMPDGQFVCDGGAGLFSSLNGKTNPAYRMHEGARARDDRWFHRSGRGGAPESGHNRHPDVALLLRRGRDRAPESRGVGSSRCPDDFGPRAGGQWFESDGLVEKPRSQTPPWPLK